MFGVQARDRGKGLEVQLNIDTVDSRIVKVLVNLMFHSNDLFRRVAWLWEVWDERSLDAGMEPGLLEILAAKSSVI